MVGEGDDAEAWADNVAVPTANHLFAVAYGADGYWVAENPDGSRSYFGTDSSGATVTSAPPF